MKPPIEGWLPLMKLELRMDSANDDIWTEKDWDALLLNIDYKLCTPFLGAGACSGTLPLASELAKSWARDYEYPFSDSSNLARVAQYLAVQQSTKFPKLLIKKMFESLPPPDFTNPNEPHRVVADLKLPIYITTNYDDFLTRAIQHAGRDPRQTICKWHLAGQRESKRNEKSAASFEPTPKTPLVFHLHGSLNEPDSMVLTEDDYLDFLMNMSDENKLIPAQIEKAICTSSLLFMGYSLEDMDVKVLFRKLAKMKLNELAGHCAVQLEPRGMVPTEEEIRRAHLQRKYLKEHFRLKRIRIFWGTCEDFAAGLRQRWEKR